MQSRFKSWVTWAAIAGALAVILESLGVFDMLGITSDKFTIAVNAVGTILVTFGILNNPTDKNNF